MSSHSTAATANPATSSSPSKARMPQAIPTVPGYINRGDLPYDYEDLSATKEEIQSKFACEGEHACHTRTLWQSAIDRRRTNQEYWDWVMSEIAEDDEVY